MFTTEQRDYVRDRVLDLARNDSRVTGGAVTGSSARGVEDEWSDVDVAFGINDGVTPEAVLDDWTEVLVRELGILHYWDLRSGSSVYRVFLLSSGLEVDIGVMPRQRFGAVGPQFRLLFGTAGHPEPAPRPDARYLIGMAWHHVIHARSCIERGRRWQAEYWISALRDQALTIACLRLQEEVFYARGVDRLPAALTEPLSAALVRSLDEDELRRALGVATAYFISELEAVDPSLCASLKPLLEEYGAPQGNSMQAPC